MKIKTSDLTGTALDWAVATCEKYTNLRKGVFSSALIMDPPRVEFGAVEFCNLNFSTDWAQGGPIIEGANITVIRANDDYEIDAKGFCTSKRIPQWFAECDRWTGHSTTTSYEGENMDPTFMIDEAHGQYGTTVLMAAMRAYVAFELGAEVDVPEAFA